MLIFEKEKFMSSNVKTKSNNCYMTFDGKALGLYDENSLFGN